MGVLECDRIGCENIMCDRYSHEYGYICNDCFDEMVLSNKLPLHFIATTKSLRIGLTEDYYSDIFVKRY